MSANGIDVSNNNGKLDISKVTGLDFVIAKATEGTNFVDPTYNFYQTKTLAAGKHFGAYHFLHAENLDGQSEALWFLRHANLKSGNSVWIDYETFGKSPAIDIEVVSLFAETVQAESAVKHVGLYSNLNGYSRVGPLGISAACDRFWLAEPTGQTETPDQPLGKYGLTWTLHQYEVLAGIDRDYSRVTAAQLTTLSKW